MTDTTYEDFLDALEQIGADQGAERPEGSWLVAIGPMGLRGVRDNSTRIVEAEGLGEIFNLFASYASERVEIDARFVRDGVEVDARFVPR